jgi:hypothetical protein
LRETVNHRHRRTGSGKRREKVQEFSSEHWHVARDHENRTAVTVTLKGASSFHNRRERPPPWQRLVDRDQTRNPRPNFECSLDDRFEQVRRTLREILSLVEQLGLVATHSSTGATGEE